MKQKKKALILTLDDDKFNYGNRLQNFASIYCLKKCGMKPYSLAKLKRFVFFISICKAIVSFDRKKRRNHIKKALFCVFEAKYLRKIDLKKWQSKHATKVFVGSDQVWNPNFWKKGDELIYSLNFMEGIDKIALSPSFGCDVIDNEYKHLFKTELPKFKKVSCRETSGCLYIKENFGLNCKLLIDPTLALSREDWAPFLKGKRYKNKYILVYCLGKISEKMENDINNLSNLYNLEVHQINENSDSFYFSDPFQFLVHIKNADIVITDSYHCSIFSFIFNKPFYVYKRYDNNKAMYNRISELLDQYKLHRKSDEYLNIHDEQSIFEHDYSDSLDVLEKKRKDFFSFINE